MQALQFVRTNVKVQGRMVMAIVLADVADRLTHSVTDIRKAIKSEDAGAVFITKDFLAPDDRSTTVVRNKNSKRRKCDAIFLQTMDEDQRDILLQGYFHVKF